MDYTLHQIIELSRLNKRIITAIIDAICIVLALFGALVIRLDSLEPVYDKGYWLMLGIIVPVSLFAFVRIGLYRAILRYVSSKFTMSILIGVGISTGLVLATSFFFNVFIPRSTPILYFLLLTILSGGARYSVKALLGTLGRERRQAVVIYGAGKSGRQLSAALASSEVYKIVAFVDDDISKKGTIVHGSKIFSRSDLSKLVNKYKVSKVLLALPKASRKARREIISELQKLSVMIQTIPSMSDVLEGKAEFHSLVDIDVEDLLGRDSVKPIDGLMQKNIEGQHVMVTGAGGSIGSELCRQIVKLRPASLIMLEVSEFALYNIEQELTKEVHDKDLTVTLVPILGSVLDKDFICSTMKNEKVRTVYHAAAYKHVPLVETNIVNGVRNNVLGTYHVALAAIEAQVDTFVFISTDKAVRPTNVMGASKRLAELVLQALADSRKGKKPRFCMVRFGNVLGSSGSVIPLFKQQIESGGPVTVTHPEITRYFMTIPEASQLVIQAGAMANGGDVFLLDMGEPVKIAELAKNLIHLSGKETKSDKNPKGDIEIRYTGLRAGEKLYEELLIDSDAKKTLHPSIMSADEHYLPLAEIEKILSQLQAAIDHADSESMTDILLTSPLNYLPNKRQSDTAKTFLETNKVVSFPR